MGANRSRAGRAFGITLIGLAALLAPRSGGAVSCGDMPGGATALAAVRADVADQCNCATSISHGAFVRCAKHVIERAVALDLRPRANSRDLLPYDVERQDDLQRQERRQQVSRARRRHLLHRRLHQLL